MSIEISEGADDGPRRVLLCAFGFGRRFVHGRPDEGTDCGEWFPHKEWFNKKLKSTLPSTQPSNSPSHQNIQPQDDAVSGSCRCDQHRTFLPLLIMYSIKLHVWFVEVT